MRKLVAFKLQSCQYPRFSAKLGNLQEDEDATRQCVSHLQYSPDQERTFSLNPLDDGKGQEEANPSDKGSNHVSRTPSLGDTTPLQCQHETNDGTHQCDQTREIHLEGDFLPCCVCRSGRSRGFEGEEKNGQHKSANGKIDVKAKGSDSISIEPWSVKGNLHTTTAS